MPRVSNNTERKCCVREANVEDGFKVTVYPALMDLEMEINNIICAVKEMHSRFVGDKYIRQRMELCKETLLGNLVLDVANIVERQVDIVKKAKEEMLAELQSKYREMAVLIDKQVKRVFPTADQRHDNFVQKRLEDSVIEYNRKAEEARLRQCEFEKKKIFYRVYQKVSDKFNPGEESVNAADSEALSVRSDVSGEPVEVKFMCSERGGFGRTHLVSPCMPEEGENGARLVNHTFSRIDQPVVNQQILEGGTEYPCPPESQLGPNQVIPPIGVTTPLPVEPKSVKILEQPKPEELKSQPTFKTIAQNSPKFTLPNDNVWKVTNLNPITKMRRVTSGTTLHTFGINKAEPLSTNDTKKVILNCEMIKSNIWIMFFYGNKPTVFCEGKVIFTSEHYFYSQISEFICANSDRSVRVSPNNQSLYFLNNNKSIIKLTPDKSGTVETPLICGIIPSDFLVEENNNVCAMDNKGTLVRNSEFSINPNSHKISIPEHDPRLKDYLFTSMEPLNDNILITAYNSSLNLTAYVLLSRGDLAWKQTLFTAAQSATIRFAKVQPAEKSKIYVLCGQITQSLDLLLWDSGVVTLVKKVVLVEPVKNGVVYVHSVVGDLDARLNAVVALVGTQSGIRQAVIPLG